MTRIQACHARKIIVAALAALALAGCGGAASTVRSPAPSVSPVISTRPGECVFGGKVSECTSADPTIEKDLYSDGDCSAAINKITINWGDGSRVQNVTTNGPSAADTPKFLADHTYSAHGSYTISVSGTSSWSQCPFYASTYTFMFTAVTATSQIDCTRQNPSACLLASNAVAGLDVGDDSDAPTGMEMKDEEVEPDGYAGAEFTDGQGTIIIANEDTDLASPFGTATPYQNSSFLAEVQIYEGLRPAALNSAVQFAQQVAATDPNARIYVTGFGLGGAEAEAQAQALASRVTGGVTFGAPGLPGYQADGSPSTVTNFVDYGDPVGNWASDPDSDLASMAPENMVHYGSVDLVGSQPNAALCLLAANTHKLMSDNVIEEIIPDLPVNSLVQRALMEIKHVQDAEEVTNAYDKALKLVSFAYLSEAALTYHTIAQYASDLGVSLTPTVAAPTATVDYYREFDPTASTATLQADASTTVNADGAVSAPGYELTASTATDELDTQTFTDQADSQYDVTYDPAQQISSLAVSDPSGTSYEISNDDAGQQAWSSRVYYYSGPDQTGTLTGVLYDWHAGGSQLKLFSGLPQGVSEETLDYSQPDATGTLLSKSSS